MLSAQIQLQKNIWNCEYQISLINERRKSLEERLNDYHIELEEYYSSKQSFDGCMNEQNSIIKKVSEIASSFKFAEAYYIHMNEEQNGLRRQITERTFSSMEIKIKEAIADIENEISMVKRNLYNFQNKLNSLQYELRQLIINQ